MQACCRATARSWSRQAMTVAVGSPTAISRARLGPDSTATWSDGTSATSAMTSLIRSSVPSSTPLARLTSVDTGGSRGRHAVRFARSVCDGHGEHDGVGAVERGGRVRRRLSARQRRRPGRYSGLQRLVRDRRGDLGAAGPQHDVAAGVGEHLRERRAPRPGTEHRDPLDRVLTPSLRR